MLPTVMAQPNPQKSIALVAERIEPSTTTSDPGSPVTAALPVLTVIDPLCVTLSVSNVEPIWTAVVCAVEMNEVGMTPPKDYGHVITYP
ncbi:hypothetical protein HPT29_001580 [Microvirga terrae]|uniref:Uncharacterized protein n=1 Tax=Microvirga terrae TaxID=2740529 RepID=A0ABY5RUL7_9HYPH|nr:MULTISPECIES: hypothetical protein [Microvirga]MBQ0822651.1 hypothetical protein [Microvirga sp. HBU67558]UVF19872.1 hypothetical protein HPT29_001580 [Microvirga terrae]